MSLLWSNICSSFHTIVYTQPMKIDDAEIYFLNFETDLDNEAGGTHIGMFLGWAVQRGLADPRLLAHARDLHSG